MANDREFIIQPLISDNRLVKLSDIDPTTSYAQIGVWQPNQQASGSPNNSYPSYAIPLSEIGKVPSLQQVLDFNHDLVNDVNLQGTNSGIGNSGTDVNAFGKGAAQDNTGSFVNALGQAAAVQNTGSSINAFGQQACLNNTGNGVNAIGSDAASDNKGDYVIAIGRQAASNNFGDNVIALGSLAGLGNTISQAVIISNSELPSYLNYAAAFAAINGVGASGNTYLYHDQSTNSIGAVRIP
jgi:hypothetical protein